jgi:hypothetical protein
MIYIKKNSTNSFVLTLGEKAGDFGIYIFEFRNEFNDGAVPFYWVAEDQSESRERYNLFYLEECVECEESSSLQTAINLTAGQYEYRVYPFIGCGDPITKDCIDDYNNPLEVGRMLVDNISFIFDAGVDEDEEEIIPVQNNNEEDNYA